jgi:putative sigma-54 modulation protein
MQIIVTFRHMEPSTALKGYVEQKLERLGKFFYRDMEANVVLSVEKHRHRAEIQIKGDRTTINCTEEKEDMYQAIDLVADKILRQVKKYKSKLHDRKSGREARANALDQALKRTEQ